MPVESEIFRPEIDLTTLPHYEESTVIDDMGPYVVILYNDDYHDFEEVIQQVQKATGYQIEICETITIEAHSRGRAIAYTGSQDDCERAARVLRQIRLQVETDKF